MKKYDCIILDNGHGKETAGKRSPDGTFLEWEFNRDIVRRVLELANENLIGDKFINLVPEEADIPLGRAGAKYDCRIKRINDLVEKNREVKYLVLSIHANAAANGEWKNAKGFGVFYDTTDVGIEEVAKHFSEEIDKQSADDAINPMSVKKWGGRGVISSFGQYSIIYFPYCDSLLLELGFMDNKEEVEYLKSDTGRAELALGIFVACQKILSETV